MNLYSVQDTSLLSLSNLSSENLGNSISYNPSVFTGLSTDPTVDRTTLNVYHSVAT